MPKAGWFLSYQCPRCGQREENPEPVPLEDICGRIAALSMVANLPGGQVALDTDVCGDCGDKSRSEATAQ